MVWGKAGSTTLASAGDDMDITSMTASNFNQLLWHKIPSGSCVGQMTFNNNSNSVYARRRSINGGGELTDASQAFIKTDISDVDDSFIVWNVCSFSGKEKLIMSIQCNRGSAGAGNAPNRVELVGKFVPSPDANITRIDINNPNGGSFDTNSNLSVLGSDLAETAEVVFPTNVQVGSRAEITDTRKMYHYADNSTKGLKAYYKFEDNVTNSQTTGDGLGSSANISLSGNTSYVTGKLSKALSFDGTDDYAIIGSSLSNFNFMHNTTHEFTVAFWFKSSDMSSMGMIFTTAGDTSSSNYGIAIRRNNSSTMAVNFAAGTNQNRLQDTQAGFSTDANWHHIVITAKASDSTNSLQYWQDGVSLGTTSNTGKVFSDTNATYAPMLGGESTSPEQDLNGQIDNLNIWNRRLTDAEIATLYNSGTGIVLTDGMANFKAWSEEGT